MKFNTEHIVPQSWFGAREPMKGDLHHLFACEPHCNTTRTNFAYFDFSFYPIPPENSHLKECEGHSPNEYVGDVWRLALAKTHFFPSIRRDNRP